MPDKKASIGCARPTGAVVGEERRTDDTNPAQSEEKRVGTVSNIMVGRKAPDFEAPAYNSGEFTNIKLSDFLGKWVVLCFYPGDYTFV